MNLENLMILTKTETRETDLENLKSQFQDLRTLILQKSAELHTLLNIHKHIYDCKCRNLNRTLITKFLRQANVNSIQRDENQERRLSEDLHIEIQLSIDSFILIVAMKFPKLGIPQLFAARWSDSPQKMNCPLVAAGVEQLAPCLLAKQGRAILPPRSVSRGEFTNSPRLTTRKR